MPSVRTLVTILLALAAGLGLGLALSGADDGPARRVGVPREVDRLTHAVSQITIRVDPSEGERRAEKRALLAYQAVLDGQPFEAVARARSQHPTAADGGFMGFVPTLVDDVFSGAIQVLKPGEMSCPIRTPLGFQILKRHTFEEGRRIEQHLGIPTHGVYIPWGDASPAGSRRTKEQAHQEALELRDALGSGRMTLDDAAERYMPEATRRPQAWLGMTRNRPQSRPGYEALSKVEPGGIVGPVEAGQAWAVLVRGRYLRSLVKHILIQHVHSEERELSTRRTRAEAAAIAQRALQEALADRSRWDSIVERYSDDARTRAAGGTMGVLDPSTMPPGFETFLYDVPVGAIHDKVVETPFGFHVVWRVN